MEYHVTQYFKAVNLSQRVVFKLQVDILWNYVTRDSKKKYNLNHGKSDQIYAQTFIQAYIYALSRALQSFWGKF